MKHDKKQYYYYDFMIIIIVAYFHGNNNPYYDFMREKESWTATVEIWQSVWLAWDGFEFEFV